MEKNSKKLGRLEKVELRQIWASESGEFTLWLATPENLDLLCETIGIELELDAQEKEVGSFRVWLKERKLSLIFNTKSVHFALNRSTQCFDDAHLKIYAARTLPCLFNGLDYSIMSEMKNGCRFPNRQPSHY